MDQTVTPFRGCTQEQFGKRLSILVDRIDEVDDVVRTAGGFVSKAGHIDVEVARLFAEYIGWEIEHPEIMKDALIGNEVYADNLRGPAFETNVRIEETERERRYCFHVDYELTSCMRILDQAFERLDSDTDWPEVPEPTWSDVVYENGYFRVDGRPVFTGGFNLMERSLVDTEQYPEWAERDESHTRSFLLKMQTLGVGIICIGVPVPGLLKGDGSVNAEMMLSIADRIDEIGRLGFKVDVLFGWHAERDTLESHWPGITAYYGNSIGFDIDHPGTREMVARVMAGLMPVLRERPAIVSWDLANEPFFHLEQWSSHSLRKYHAWLQDEYATIGRLNAVWETDYPDFSAIPLPTEKAGDRCSAGEWYDRVTFHRARVTSFFTCVQSEIRLYVPDAVVHLKAQDNSSLGPRPEAVTEGIDREALTPISTLQGVDTRPLPVTEPRMAAHAASDGSDAILGYDDSHYGFHWLGQSFLYDYLTSLQPEVPIVDFEYHAFSINAIRIPTIRPSHPNAALWMAHMHGLIGNIAWYWHRRYGPYPFPSEYYAMWLYGSISTQPLIAAEYFRTMLKLNMFAREIEALATDRRRPVRLLVSKPSYIHNQRHINALHRAYEGSCFYGLRVSFITEQMLTTIGAPDDCKLIIIPDAEYVSLPALDVLNQALQRGVQLVRFGERKPAFDAHGLQHAPETIAFMSAVPVIQYASAPELSEELSRFLSPLSADLPVQVRSLDGTGAFGVMHRHAGVDGREIVLLINVSGAPTHVRLHSPGDRAVGGYDMLNGETVIGSRVAMPFQGVRLIRISR